MGWLEALHRSVDRLAHAPGVKDLAMRRYRRRFANNVDANMFLGVFDSFEAAANSAPAVRPLGYDNDASANLAYSPDIKPRDYPAVFWLEKAIASGLSTVFDLGGHVGVRYYGYRRLIDFPSTLRWTVCDVPAVAARGRELAAGRAPHGQLTFTSDYQAAADHEILFASGSLQYLPMSLAELLAGLPRKPRRLVINTTPIHASRSFFTLNSIGTAFCAYRVQSRDGFIGELRALGYVKLDEWENTGKAMTLPYTDGYDVPHYSGFCFSLPDGRG